MKTVRVKIDPAGPESLATGRIDAARVDATTEGGGGWGQVLNLLICVRHGPIRACRRSYMGAALAAPPSPRCLSSRSGGSRD